MHLHFFFYLCIYYYLSFGARALHGECRDLNGRMILQGMYYMSEPGSCTLCVCDSGLPKFCKAVLCSPPLDCKSFRLGNSCCDFICLDDALQKSEASAEIGLRLLATALILGLSISLIFILVLRLRQRKLLRESQNRRTDEDRSIGYITGSLGYLPQTYLSAHSAPEHIEFRYDEPPSQYPLWKPPGNYFPRGEAPPPYDEAISQVRNQVTISSSNTLINMSHRTIPVNLTTNSTICIVDPGNTISPEVTRTRLANTNNVLQSLDASMKCFVNNSNTIVRSELTTNSLKQNVSIVKCKKDVTTTTAGITPSVHSSVSLPRSRTSEAVLVNLPTPQHYDKPSSKIRCEISINTPADNYFSLRRSVAEDVGTTVSNVSDKLVDRGEQTQLESPETNIVSSYVDLIPPPQLDCCNDELDTRCDVYFEDVVIGLPTVLNQDNNRGYDERVENNKNQDCSQVDEEVTLGDSQLTLVEDQQSSSCDCSSYQCLPNDDNDDYRSECENCKSGPGSSYFLDEEPEQPETMTLQRVPKEQDEFESQEQYYRTSLTLPTNCKRPKMSILSNARENWFSSMPESDDTSSEEE